MAQTTLYEVAERAGVSLATASRVLNGSTRQVGEQLRLRVLKAAEELRYTANGPAQAMARGHSNTLGLVVSDITDPYFTQIAAGVVEAADAHQLTVTMGSTHRETDREIRHLATFRSQRARGVIIVGSRASVEAESRFDEEIAAYRETGGTVVMISQPVGDLPVVQVENRRLATELAAALVEQGHREFSILAGPSALTTAVDRTAGFRAGLKAAGITVPKDRVVAGGFTRDGGHSSMQELLAHTRTPGCVFAVTDVMALGAIAAIREAGLEPGVDVPIAGFDDIPTLADVLPPLTTVNLPLRTMGRTAVELLVADAEATSRTIGGSVVLRASTALT